MLVQKPQSKIFIQSLEDDLKIDHTYKMSESLCSREHDYCSTHSWATGDWAVAAATTMTRKVDKFSARR